MSNVKENNGLAEKMIPLMVANQISPGQNSALSVLLNEMAQEYLEKFKKDKDRKQRQAEAGIQAAKDAAKNKADEQARCSHRKRNNEPRTGGQKLSNGQIVIVCLGCSKEWHNPPIAELGQEACPRELFPSPDIIGG